MFLKKPLFIKKLKITMIINIENFIINKGGVNGIPNKGNFLLSFRNNTGSDVTVSVFDETNLFKYKTDNPIITSAKVNFIPGNTEIDIKNTDTSTNAFVVPSSVLAAEMKIDFDGGMFSFGSEMPFNSSFRDIVFYGGVGAAGTSDVPDYFLGFLLIDCPNLNPITPFFFNTIWWEPRKIGNGFLYSTWQNNPSILTAVVPNTTNWPVKSIGNNFITATWGSCTSLTTISYPDTSNWNVTGGVGDFFLALACYDCPNITESIMPDTSNWNITSIGNFFLYQTWYNSSSLQTVIAPDTSNWNVTGSVGNFFMWNTFGYAFSTSGLRELTLKGSVYTGNIKELYDNSGWLENSKIDYIKVDNNLISEYQSSPSWSNIDNNKFISW
jgi:hypothetical protein